MYGIFVYLKHRNINGVSVEYNINFYSELLLRNLPGGESYEHASNTR